MIKTQVNPDFIRSLMWETPEFPHQVFAQVTWSNGDREMFHGDDAVIAIASFKLKHTTGISLAAIQRILETEIEDERIFSITHDFHARFLTYPDGYNLKLESDVGTIYEYEDLLQTKQEAVFKISDFFEVKWCGDGKSKGWIFQGKSNIKTQTLCNTFKL